MSDVTQTSAGGFVPSEPTKAQGPDLGAQELGGFHFPNPKDIINQIENAANTIKNSVQQAANSAKNEVQSELNSAKSQLQQTASQLESKIQGEITDVKNELDKVDSKIADVLKHIITAAESGVLNKIADVLEKDGPTTGGFSSTIGVVQVSFSFPDIPSAIEAIRGAVKNGIHNETDAIVFLKQIAPPSVDVSIGTGATLPIVDVGVQIGGDFSFDLDDFIDKAAKQFGITLPEEDQGDVGAEYDEASDDLPAGWHKAIISPSGCVYTKDGFVSAESQHHDTLLPDGGVAPDDNAPPVSPTPIDKNKGLGIRFNRHKFHSHRPALLGADPAAETPANLQAAYDDFHVPHDIPKRKKPYSWEKKRRPRRG